jgi:hypothetical protein
VGAHVHRQCVQTSKTGLQTVRVHNELVMKLIRALPLLDSNLKLLALLQPTYYNNQDNEEKGQVSQKKYDY